MGTIGIVDVPSGRSKDRGVEDEKKRGPKEDILRRMTTKNGRRKYIYVKR